MLRGGIEMTLLSNGARSLKPFPTLIAQKASVEALMGPQDEVEKMVSAFAKRRNCIVDRLNGM